MNPSEIDLNALDDELATNYTSFLHLIVHFLPHLQSVSKSGQEAYLAVVTSGLALVPIPTCANYCASKVCWSSNDRNLPSAQSAKLSFCRPLYTTSSSHSANNSRNRTRTFTSSKSCHLSSRPNSTTTNTNLL